jgi:hypothetical protein
VKTRQINQFTTEETEHFSRESNLSSKTENQELILKLDGEEKKLSTCRKEITRDNRDYSPLRDIEGVEKKTVFNNGSRGRGESRSKHRYKFTRELVEKHDEVVLIKREHNSGGNINGVDYSKDEKLAEWRLIAHE